MPGAAWVGWAERAARPGPHGGQGECWGGNPPPRRVRGCPRRAARLRGRDVGALRPSCHPGRLLAVVLPPGTHLRRQRAERRCSAHQARPGREGREQASALHLCICLSIRASPSPTHPSISPSIHPSYTAASPSSHLSSPRSCQSVRLCLPHGEQPALGGFVSRPPGTPQHLHPGARSPPGAQAVCTARSLPLPPYVAREGRAVRPGPAAPRARCPHAHSSREHPCPTPEQKLVVEAESGT